jgi:phage terminase small subunit
MTQKSIPQARKEQKQAAAKSAIKTRQSAQKKKTQQKQASTKPAKAKKEDSIDVHTDVLSPKQIRFIDEYLIDFNASAAAIRAGYSKKTAHSIGFENLRKPEIQQAIQAKQKELAHKAGVTRERIVEEAARLSFSDLRKLFDVDGNLKPLHELDDATAAAISSVELQVSGNGDDVVMTKKIKLWDKNSALDKLLKHLGMENDNKGDIEDRLKRVLDMG